MGGRLVLKLESIVKTFPGVKALDGVHLEIFEGEVHALCGENGAGKSTLMKIIAGAQPYTSGAMYLDGKEVVFHSAKDAEKHGIAMIYQEFNMVPELSVAENMYLGRLPVSPFGKVDWNKLYREAQENLDHLGLKFSAKTKVKNLSVAEAQMTEIAKCLTIGAKIIIMDEPTDSLTQKEIDVLFQIVRKLKQDGITVIYISHRLEELFEICDRITVLRDGAYVDCANIADVNKDWLIGKMIGRDLKDTFPPRRRVHSEEVVLETCNLCGERFQNVSFRLHKGEILGFSGLVGAGRTEVMRAIFGADKICSGEMKLFGQTVHMTHPCQAVERGMGFATEDRKAQGLFLNQTIKDNIAIASPKRVSTKGFVSGKEEVKLANQYMKELKIAAPDIHKVCKFLSGGNQQKVVLSKWLASECRILILDEPTRGIDVGAKFEIYLLMDQLANAGVSIIMISSEMPEIMAVSDRMIVMHEGTVTGEITHEDYTEENIMKLASGEKRKKES